MDENSQNDIKVALVGPSESGKSSFIKFLKGESISDRDKGDIFLTTSSGYNDTWGVQVHILDWEYLTT